MPIRQAEAPDLEYVFWDFGLDSPNPEQGTEPINDEPLLVKETVPEENPTTFLTLDLQLLAIIAFTFILVVAMIVSITIYGCIRCKKTDTLIPPVPTTKFG